MGLNKVIGFIQQWTFTEQISIATLLLATYFIIMKLWISWRDNKRLIKFPPGPWGIPFIGSIWLAKVFGKFYKYMYNKIKY